MPEKNRCFKTHMIFALVILLTGCQSAKTPALLSQKTTVSVIHSGLFEDVTEQAGITFQHTNSEGKRALFGDSVGGGCAFLDVDGDGLQDILLLSCGHFGKPVSTDPPNLALYHNNGTFTDITRGSGLDIPLGYSQAVAVGDYDNDGRPDIFVAGYGGCFLFHNETQGNHIVFRNVTQQAGLTDTDHSIRWASGAVWGDYDNDGKLDLYLVHYCVWSPETDKVCARADGTPGYCSPVVYQPDSGRLFHNEGNGHFRDVTNKAGLGKLHGRGLAAAWLDYDGDGKQDLYIANDLNPNQLLHNNGNGSFTEVGIASGTALGSNGKSASGMGIALGDYDHTGHESLFITNLNSQMFSLFHNEGGGLFTFASDRAGLAEATLSHGGWGVAFADFDRDGWVDIISGNGNVHPLVASDLGASYAEAKGLYHNSGNGTFADISSTAGALTEPHPTRGLAIGDYDNDGRLDVLCIHRNERAKLYRNVSSDKNHWLLLNLKGVKSNRDGAGAKIWVTNGAMRQYAECRLGSSYASSSDKRLFFGLGAAQVVNKLEIRWPSGQRDSYTSLAADHIYRVTEGKGYAVETRAGAARIP